VRREGAAAKPLKLADRPASPLEKLAYLQAIWDFFSGFVSLTRRAAFWPVRDRQFGPDVSL
jgi:hypothetical protein